ncbi:hypothetical protein [Ligilactobacillus saerimneri]|uniref:hypothetical protein n=1 Tax=Ligilactobacillus saerimneri TaxID=228229 RepID=UPI0003F8FFC5|nr:hypothetical protein [Ligilactobacillus saerimneri]
MNNRIKAILTPRYNWLMLLLDLVVLGTSIYRLNIYTAFIVLVDLSFALQNGVILHGYRLQQGTQLTANKREALLQLEANNMGKVLAALLYLGGYYFPFHDSANMLQNGAAVLVMVLAYFIFAQAYYRWQKRKISD